MHVYKKVFMKYKKQGSWLIVRKGPEQPGDRRGGLTLFFSGIFCTEFSTVCVLLKTVF